MAGQNQEDTLLPLMDNILDSKDYDPLGGSYPALRQCYIHIPLSGFAPDSCTLHYLIS
jgi:hypothetical protein